MAESESNEKDIFALSPQELSARIEEIGLTAGRAQEQADKTNMEIALDRSITLGAVVNKLALIKMNLAGPYEELQLLETAKQLIGELGLASTVSVDTSLEKLISQETVKDLAERLRIHREDLGLSQRELAKQLGVSRYYVLNAENAKTTKAVLKLSKLLFGYPSTTD